MPKSLPTPEYESFAERFIAANAGLKAGSMYGMVCVKNDNNKALCGTYGGGLVVSRRPDCSEGTRNRGPAAFDPSGRGKPMKGWVVLPASAKRR